MLATTVLAHATIDHTTPGSMIILQYGLETQAKWVRVDKRRESLWLPSGSGTVTPQQHEHELLAGWFSLLRARRCGGLLSSLGPSHTNFCIVWRQLVQLRVRELRR
jgi:hypothetical protein